MTVDQKITLIAVIGSTISTILGALIAAPWVNNWIKDRLRKNKYTIYSHQKGQVKIDLALKNIAQETGAHLVTLWGFENGTYFTSGYPELYTSCVAQYPLPDDKLDKGNGEFIAMPDMTEMFKRRKYTKFTRLFAALEDIEVNEYVFDTEFKFNDYQSGVADMFGIQSYYVFKIRDTRIKNLERQWVHTLCIGFNQKHDISETDRRFIMAEIETLKSYLLL